MAVRTSSLQARVTGPGVAARRSRVPVAIAVAGDLLALVATMAVTLGLRHATGAGEEALRRHLLVYLLSLPVWFAAIGHYRLYPGRDLGSRIEEFRRIVHAVWAGVLGVVVIGYTLNFAVPLREILLLLLFAVVFLTSTREIVRRVIARLHVAGRLLRPTVVVGGNLEGLALCAMLDEKRFLGYGVIGFIDDDSPAGRELLPHQPVLGAVADTREIVASYGATDVLITGSALDPALCNDLVRDLTDAGVHVEISSMLRDVAPERLRIRPLGRYTVLEVERDQLIGWRALAKRAFDVAISLALLLVTLPVLPIVALLIKIDSRGPVFFRHTRVGKDGEPFPVFKFRTMVRDAEDLLPSLMERNEAEGTLFKLRDDPRCTRVGRWLRRLSLDELPQLGNVLLGHMSMVGPRPAPPNEVARWSDDMHRRLRVRPGITGMWQVSGRSEASFEEYVRFDLYYVNNWSLLTDLAIIAKTVPSVLFGRGAY